MCAFVFVPEEVSGSMATGYSVMMPRSARDMISGPHVTGDPPNGTGASAPLFMSTVD